MIRHLDFILAGKAVFTVTDKVSGKHYTYRINEADTKGVYFARLGIGFEDAIYMGVIRWRNGAPELFLSTKSKVSRNSDSFRVLNLTLLLAATDQLEESKVIKFQHEGKCCVCARPLTNSESIDLGIGPECRGKAGM